MHIDLTSFAGTCTCGKTHTLATQFILVESGATQKLPEVAAALHLTKNGVVVCDTNTHLYARQAAERVTNSLLAESPIVTLPAQNLHANEHAVALLENALPKHAAWLLLAGSGTVHDAGRYVANQRGIPFLSFPTAASVDGFVSTVCAMTWHGFKKTMPGVAPLAVVADTDVFAAAPPRLTAAGIGDVLGKYTSLADWEISHIATGEDYCKRIADISYEAVAAVQDNLAAIRTGEKPALEQLMYALLLSGLAMQMWGNSRPASGAEHHMSHLWEMEAINPHIDALHGEKVGVGLNLVLPFYKQVAAMDALVPKPYQGLPLELLQQKFGPLYEDLRAENTPDLLADINPATVAAHFPAIAAVVQKLPDPAVLRQEMQQAGCPTQLADIGLPETLLQESLLLSPFVRRRLTFLRLCKRFQTGV